MAAAERSVWFVRHGHRADDGPEPSPGLGRASLSALGHAEAAAFAQDLGPRPDLIVISSFLRTAQTAAPLRARFPDVPCETWAVEEFTFLPAAAFDQTTMAERAPASRAYWETGDPDLHPGAGGESFREFIGRADACLARLTARAEAFTIVVTHGFTMKALLWRLQNPLAPVDRAAFAAYRAVNEAVSIPTLAVLPVSFASGRPPVAGALFRPRPPQVADDPRNQGNAV